MGKCVSTAIAPADPSRKRRADGKKEKRQAVKKARTPASPCAYRPPPPLSDSFDAAKEPRDWVDVYMDPFACVRHAYLARWPADGRWHCAACHQRVDGGGPDDNDDDDDDRGPGGGEPAARLAEEDRLAAACARQDAAAFGVDCGDDDDAFRENAAEASHARGVTAAWLVAWTAGKDCWDWPTWEVRERIVLPETAAARCRYVELPAVAEAHVGRRGARPAVGPADAFATHCRAAPWCDLVAAVTDGMGPVLHSQ